MEIREFFEEIGFKVARVSSGGKYNAYCPLHIDTEPSLFLDPKGDQYKCFGSCGQKGRGLGKFFRIVNPQEGSKWEARFNLLFPYIQITSFLEPNSSSVEKVDIDVSSIPYASDTIPYLVERNITQETIQIFQVKYHRYWDALVVPFFFRGQEIGYSRRNLSSKPRYQNSDASIIQSYLFPIDYLVLKKDEPILLVEGLFDAIRAHQEGYTNCLSILGGGLSDEQIHLMAQYTRSVTFCPDRDRQGLSIAENATKSLLRLGFNISYAQIQGGSKDIASSNKIGFNSASYFQLKYNRNSLKKFIGVN